ncbi:MAG TPA: hypothetical protein VG291_10460 [Xanthobacteraceae bacterium]|jgi:hypothetical protein|nr:hypothetical protein [Xanthobacteraceae bacterium]
MWTCALHVSAPRYVAIEACGLVANMNDSNHAAPYYRQGRATTVVAMRCAVATFKSHQTQAAHCGDPKVSKAA